MEILADSEHWKHFLSWKIGKLNVAGEKMGKKKKRKPWQDEYCCGLKLYTGGRREGLVTIHSVLHSQLQSDIF